MEHEIRDWAREKFGGEVSVRHDRDGLSNLTYRLELDGTEYILKVSKGIVESKVGHEAKILDVLEYEGIDSVPEKFFYGSQSELGEEVLIQTAVGERESSIKKLDEKQRENFIRLLAEIHSKGPETYNQVFGLDRAGSGNLIGDIRRSLENHARPRFRVYREETGDYDPRVGKIFERQEELVDRMAQEDGKVEFRLVHGDLSRNMRVEGQQVFLYDWENASIGIPRFELVFLFLHNNMDHEERKNFLDDYREHREIPEPAENAADDYEKYLRIHDMLWAAKMKEKALNAGKDPSEYEEMFEERVDNLWSELEV